MPPKRLGKRRQDDDGSSSRPPKKGGKKQEPTYDTYDEAMDGGVEMEEKGERYKDGDKAHRFYEKALDLYKKAYDLEPTYDAAYNQARVLFTLATSFFLPPISVSYLTTSIETYRHAITLTEDSTLQLDAAFNLAEALSALAEVIEDLHPERKDQVRSLREEMKQILGTVLAGQEEYLAQNSEDIEVDQASEMVDDSEVPEEVQQEVEEEGEGMELDKPAGQENGEEETTTYETHVPTPTSFVETALMLVEVHMLLWKTAEPPCPPSDAQQAEVRAVLDKASKMVTPGKQAELDLAEISVLIAMDETVWEAFKAEAKPGTGIEKSLEGAVGALTSLLASLDTYPPEEPTLRADILMVLAETHTSIAHRMTYLSSQLPSGPSPLAQGAWVHLTEAITHLGKALDLPILSGMPKTFKPNVLLQLSKASLSRARLSNVNDTAKRNVQQLLSNAITWATRAADLLGWGGFIKPGFGAPAAPYPGGWDTEWLGRSVLLQYIRVDIVSQRCAPPGVEYTYQEQAKALVTRLDGLQGDRKIKGEDVDRWLLELAEEEEGMDESERGMWKSLPLA